MDQSFNDPKKRSNRLAIIFIVKLLLFYFLFDFGNRFMNSVLSETGRYYNMWLAENFNYIQWVRTSLLAPATAIIKGFGFYAIHNKTDVMVVDGPYLRVNYSCLGLGVMSFFTAFVIAFPAKVKPKLKLLVIGTIMIYVLNVFRIAGLGVLLASFKSQQDNFTYHHEIFNILVYICIFILIYFWIKKNTNITLKKDSSE